MKFLDKKLFFPYIFIVFCLIFFVSRYLSSSQYGAMEDELFSMDFNTKYSVKELFSSPDRAHPPLWYVLMDLPTSILGVDYGIFYYRFIQVLILFFFLVTSLLYFRKKLPDNFMLIFFSLFLSNVYLIHLTTQHRMYAMILGISVLYSFYWYHVIKNDKDESFKHFILLGIIAAIGFLTNYSIIWVLPIWPLSYVFCKKDLDALKKLAVFSLTFLLLVSWFFPIFISQTTTFIDQNYLAFNLTNVMRLIGNHFGILGIIGGEKQNILLIFFSFLVCYLFFLRWNGTKNGYFKAMLISTLSMSFLFLIVVRLTGSRLFYARVSIPLVVAFYILIADSFNKSKYSKIMICLLIAFQLSQFVFYFFPGEGFSRIYEPYYYYSNPISYFKDYSFPKNSCLFPIPSWYKFAVTYYLEDDVRVISFEDFIEKYSSGLNECSEIYILNKYSVANEYVDREFNQINAAGYGMKPIVRHADQILYLLNKI